LLTTAPALTIVAPGAARATTAMPPAGALQFAILRGDSSIGQHNVQLRQDGAVWTATINVEIAVSIGPVVVYRYKLAAKETWKDGRFEAFESDTNDDGTKLWVRARRESEGVVAEASGVTRVVMSADAIPMTHWNRQCMRAPLFAAKDGKPARPNVRPRGEETISLGNGRAIKAERYTLTGDIALDDWYDEAGSWASMRTVGRDGSVITYRRSA
jgi:hypothetical protein